MYAQTVNLLSNLLSTQKTKSKVSFSSLSFGHLLINMKLKVSLKITFDCTMKLRKSSRFYSYKKRHLALKPIDRVRMKRMISGIELFLKTRNEIGVYRYRYEDDKKILINACNASALMCLLSFLRISIERPCVQPAIHHVTRTIESFTPAECWRLFRFQKEDLPRLKVALRMPNVVILEDDNRLRFTGEEVMLFSLCRLAYPLRLEDLASTTLDAMGKSIQVLLKKKKVRICIEWHCGEIVKLFAFLDLRHNIKIRHQKCDLLYFAASLLRICHTCLNGNNTLSTSTWFLQHWRLICKLCR